MSRDTVAKKTPESGKRKPAKPAAKTLAMAESAIVMPPAAPPKIPHICKDWDQYYDLIERGGFPFIVRKGKKAYDGDEIQKYIVPPYESW